MYELTVEAHFSAAHNIRGYEGACERLHGHNWRVEAAVEAKGLTPIGLAIDFKVLKTALEGVVGALDHAYLNDLSPFDKTNATAENIARHIYSELSKIVNDSNAKVKKVRVWESEKCSAAYYE